MRTNVSLKNCDAIIINLKWGKAAQLKNMSRSDGGNGAAGGGDVLLIYGRQKRKVKSQTRKISLSQVKAKGRRADCNYS
jgi:hypothetical protein